MTPIALTNVGRAITIWGAIENGINDGVSKLTRNLGILFWGLRGWVTFFWVWGMI